jgi:hypothetical protein
MRKILLGTTLLVTAIFLSVSGCATTEKYEAKLNSWVGDSINELMASWGYPDGSFEAPNGNKVYVYSHRSSFTTPIQTTVHTNLYGPPTASTTGGQTLNLWCKTYFEVDNAKNIIKWSWEGNNCTSY